ncbi:hypothetical protein [Acinetobacter baumannii]
MVEGAPEGAWKYISGWHSRYRGEVKDWGVFKPQYEAYHPAASSSNAGRFDAKMRQLECVDLTDLKRLVESVDLVNSLGGIKAARSEAHKDCFVYNQPLLAAIADHESIYGGSHA